MTKHFLAPPFTSTIFPEDNSSLHEFLIQVFLIHGFSTSMATIHEKKEKGKKMEGGFHDAI
ncbi:hypothetical protein LG290_11460 [Halomonas sediminis]